MLARFDNWFGAAILLALALSAGCAGNKGFATGHSGSLPGGSAAGCLELHVRLPEHGIDSDPLPVSLVLTNTSRERVAYSFLNPYSDFQIRVHDAAGAPCPLTSFGKTSLAQDMPGFTAPSAGSKRVNVRGGSRIDAFLEPAGNPGSSSREWQVDLNRCYLLKPGRYTLDVIYPQTGPGECRTEATVRFEISARDAGH